MGSTERGGENMTKVGLSTICIFELSGDFSTFLATNFSSLISII